MRAIMHLTNETKNRTIMCTKRILDALVQGASLDDPKQDEIRDSAVRAIERLATEFSNRGTMARHEGLLVAIAKRRIITHLDSINKMATFNKYVMMGAA